MPIATCPDLLTATPLACWLGGRVDKVDAPPIRYFFPGFSFIIPTLTTFFVFGLNYKILLSSAVEYTVPWGLIARPQV